MVCTAKRGSRATRLLPSAQMGPRCASMTNTSFRFANSGHSLLNKMNPRSHLLKQETEITAKDRTQSPQYLARGLARTNSFLQRWAGVYHLYLTQNSSLNPNPEQSHAGFGRIATLRIPGLAQICWTACHSRSAASRVLGFRIHRARVLNHVFFEVVPFDGGFDPRFELKNCSRPRTPEIVLGMVARSTALLHCGSASDIMNNNQHPS